MFILRPICIPVHRTFGLPRASFHPSPQRRASLTLFAHTNVPDSRLARRRTPPSLLAPSLIIRPAEHNWRETSQICHCTLPTTSLHPGTPIVRISRGLQMITTAFQAYQICNLGSFWKSELIVFCPTHQWMLCACCRYVMEPLPAAS